MNSFLPTFVTYSARLVPVTLLPLKISRQGMRRRPSSWCSDTVGGIGQGWRDTISSGCNGFVWQPVREWKPAGLTSLPLIVLQTHLETRFTWNFREALAARNEIGWPSPRGNEGPVYRSTCGRRLPVHPVFFMRVSTYVRPCPFSLAGTLFPM